MQDAYLLDTSIASIAWDGGHKQHQQVRQRLADLSKDSISVSVITIAEVLYGLEVSKSIDQTRFNAVKRAVFSYKIWDINRHTTQVYAKIRGRLFEVYSPKSKRGRLTQKQPEDLIEPTTAKELGIQENDLWIVSVAVQYDLRFITKDRKLQPILDAANETWGYNRADVWILSN